MAKIDTVRGMYTRMKIKRRIDANRIVGTLGFREHFSSHPGRHSWEICGHPVYWWVMKCAMETKHIEKILVWTEDKKAKKVAREMSDKFVIFNRTVEECKEPMWKFVDDLKANKSRVNTQKNWTYRDEEIKELLGFEPTLFVYFAANQPLVRAKSVTKLIEKYFEDDIAETATLAARNIVNPSFYIKDPDYPEYLIRCGFTDYGTRQERPDTYTPIGPAIIPYHKDKVHSVSSRLVYVEVGGDEISDIHDEDDLELAEFKMRKRLERGEDGGK